jgi:succinate dehydrogenase/fumarate reductase flavoprotein subunit
MREIRVGASKGQRTPHELADVIEGRPQVDADLDLSEAVLETDVLVVGGGGAGASAALLAQENGAKVVIVTKLRFGDANTMMAQGGIQAADRPEDSPSIHYLDVIGGGHFTNVPELVEALVKDAPLVIQWLEELGVMFDKQPDGTMVEAHGGGTSRKRMHSARDYSGAEIMRTLRDEVRNRPNIEVIEFAPVVEIVLDDNGRIAGALAKNLETDQVFYIKAKSVILATGGITRDSPRPIISALQAMAW